MAKSLSKELESLPLRHLYDLGFSGRSITGSDPFQGFNVNEQFRSIMLVHHDAPVGGYRQTGQFRFGRKRLNRPWG